MIDLSSIGFLAVAFTSKSLAILDMRGPDVILREGFDEDGIAVKKKKKKGNVQNVLGEQAEVGAMKWVVAGMGTGESCLQSAHLVSLVNVVQTLLQDLG